MKRLHPRRRIVGGTHRVTDPYGRDETLYKRVEPEKWKYYFGTIISI